MIISISSIMDVNWSQKAHRSLVVGYRTKQYNIPSALCASSSCGQLNPVVMMADMTRERIRKLFNSVELSVSSYDTAWVAMVPSPDSPKSPLFPDCLNWLMDNQLNDGSWGLVDNDTPMLNDTLSSTLACIVALKRWNVGEHHINKGLRYIESNIASATDKDQPSPFGFDIIFPHMLEYAKNLKINIPLKKIELSSMLYDSELEIRRCDSKERQAYLAYVSEGLGRFYDWNMVMKYQMKNGSILNSPSATAAALMHHQSDAGCLDYLTSVLDKFGNAVPTIYPLDIYTRLSMVDTLKRLGIARHFRVEIQNVLDETYRCWMQGEEQLLMDVVTCCLAFRLLRTHGYQVTSDPLAKLTKEGAYNMNSSEEPFKDIHAALEVYRASNIIYQDESGFGELNLRSADFLRQKMFTSSDTLSQFIQKEVEITLKFPVNADLERMSSRRNINNYIIDDTRILKTSYRSSNISNEHYLRLAVEDFNACQSIYRKELESINRWVVDCRLDQLKFARQREAYCYFTAASTMSSPELSYARLTWAKCSIICTVYDDFYDTERSMDEWTNLIHCIEKWDVDVATDCYSETVAILFMALKDLVSWIGDKAVKWQERDVTSHVIEIWLELANGMLSEATWTRDACVPTMNDYMEAAYPSIGLGVTVLPALYFLGPKLSEEIIQSSEYHNLFRLMSTHARLRNDIRGFKRESKEGKLNAVTLHEKYGKCGIEEAEVIEDIMIMINNQERELMKLVMEEKGSIVPRACKNIFWTTSNILNLFYATYDGFSGNDILDIVKEVIYEPVSHRLID